MAAISRRSRRTCNWPSRLLGAMAALLALAGVAEAQSSAPQVSVAGGVLAGVRDQVVISFKGAPYAAAPVGELRWRPPQPVASWKGVRQANGYGAFCEQKYNAADNGVG